MMSDEEDIGLYNLAARRSDSIASSPDRKLHLRRLSIISVLKGEERTPIKSPSNPNLLNASPKMTPRKLSRSATLPRLVSQRSESSLGSGIREEFNMMVMESERVHQLRRWILAMVIGK